MRQPTRLSRLARSRINYGYGATGNPRRAVDMSNAPEVLWTPSDKVKIAPILFLGYW